MLACFDGSGRDVVDISAASFSRSGGVGGGRRLFCDKGRRARVLEVARTVTWE